MQVVYACHSCVQTYIADLTAGISVESDLQDLIRLAAAVTNKLKLRTTARAAAAAAEPWGTRANGEGSHHPGRRGSDHGHGLKEFVVLPAPASMTKLKGACGDFSAAAVLKKALRSADGAAAGTAAAAGSPEDWVLLDQS